MPLCTHIHSAPNNYGETSNSCETHDEKERANARVKPKLWQPPQNLMNLKLFNQWIVMAGNNFKSSISFSVYRWTHQIMHCAHIYTYKRAHTYCMSCTSFPPLSMYSSTDCRLFNLNHNILRFYLARCSFANNPHQSLALTTCWIISVFGSQSWAFYISIYLCACAWN